MVLAINRTDSLGVFIDQYLRIIKKIICDFNCSFSLETTLYLGTGVANAYMRFLSIWSQKMSEKSSGIQEVLLFMFLAKARKKGRRQLEFNTRTSMVQLTIKYRQRRRKMYIVSTVLSHCLTDKCPNVIQKPPEQETKLYHFHSMPWLGHMIDGGLHLSLP